MKQLRPGMINCAALILFGAGMCQAQTNGAILEINGTVTQGELSSQSVDLVVNDGAIHSSTVPCNPQLNNCHTVPLPNSPYTASNCGTGDQIATDAYVLQSGAPTGCDPGDYYEGNTISQNDGHFNFISPPGSLPSYEFDITTHYQCGPNSGSCNLGTTLTTTTGTINGVPNSTITSGDTGFLIVTNRGSSTFTGTITLSGTSPKCGPEGGGPASDSVTGTLAPSNANAPSSWTFALAQDSSGCGGFTGTITSQQGAQTVTPGGTVTFSLGPLNQSWFFPLGTTALTGEQFDDSVIFEDPATLDATLVGGSSGNNPPFSGGSAVPPGAKCVHVGGGSCPVIMNHCSILCTQNPTYPGCSAGVASVPLATCGDIKPPRGKLMLVNSDFTSPDSLNPAYLIAHDAPVIPDWANISNRGGTQYVPGCTKPPCHQGGGTGGANGREALFDLKLPCQLLTYTFNQTAVPPGGDAEVSGILNFCNSVVGEQTFFGILIGTATLRLEGPLANDCSNPNQIVTLTSFPVFLWPGFNQPFSFQFDVPENACPGTSLKVTSVISSGTINFVVDGPAISVQ